MLDTNGKIRFWNLARERNCIVLEEKFKEKMANLLLKVCKTKYQIAKRTGVSRRTFSKLLNEKYPKVTCRIIKCLGKFLIDNGHNEFNLAEIEKNIIWIGASQGVGICNPKLPFNFTTQSGARFLSAISGDGCITRGSRSRNHIGYGTLIYTNSNKSLQNAVIEDAINIFGGNNDLATTKGIYVFFTSICRDALEIITDFKGMKSENNPYVPNFVFENDKLMCSWIEQIIADEGQIRNYPKQYEKSIVWRRSVDMTNIYFDFKSEYENATNKSKVLQEIGKIRKCNLIEGEKKMLDKLYISYILKPISIYFTKDEKVKLRWEIRIGRKENLRRLRKLIKIPHDEKDKKFTTMLK